MNIVRNLYALLILTLCGSSCLFGQQQGNFYYYKGEPVSLPVNNQRFFVYIDTNNISLEVLEKEYRITEVLNSNDENVLGIQLNIPNDNYDSIVSVLKAKDYVVDVEVVVGDSVFYNTDQLFYVKLHHPDDYVLLQNTASKTRTEIVCEVPHCLNWYRLKVSKFSVGNSIESANEFWETGYFADIDPGFIIHFEPNTETYCVTDTRFNEQWGMQSKTIRLIRPIRRPICTIRPIRRPIIRRPLQ